MSSSTASSERIQRIAQLLVELEAIDHNAGPDDQARSSLRHLFWQILGLNGAELAPSRYPVEQCPNCGADAPNPKSPYCGEVCRSQAAFVRQCRSAVDSGAIQDSEKQVGLGQAFWREIGGGLPRRTALVPASTIKRLMEKADSKCHRCGGVAVGIEHLRGACNRATNLQPVCADCNPDHGFDDSVFLSSTQCRARILELAERVSSESALRISDDPVDWDWRAYIKHRS